MSFASIQVNSPKETFESRKAPQSNEAPLEPVSGGSLVHLVAERRRTSEPSGILAQWGRHPPQLLGRIRLKAWEHPYPAEMLASLAQTQQCLLSQYHEAHLQQKSAGYTSDDAVKTGQPKGETVTFIFKSAWIQTGNSACMADLSEASLQ